MKQANSKNERLSRKQLIYVVASVAVVTGTVAVWRQLNADLARASRIAVNGYRHNDPNAIYNYSLEYERQTLGLTEEKFRKVWDRLLSPELAKVKFKDVESSQALNHPPSQGIADIEVILPNGETFKVATESWMTEEGPKVSVLNNVLGVAWAVNYIISNPNKYHGGKANWATARLTGLNRDRKFLESIGINGLIELNGYYSNWDNLKTKWTQVEGQFQSSKK